MVRRLAKTGESETVPLPGFYLAGEIESVGKAVAGFTGGDQVFAASGIRFGACAEYTCLPSTYTIATKPANMSYAEAAAVPLGGLNALHFIRRAKIQSGEKVLVNGGCGTIGTFAVQLAKYFGVEVTGVDSTDKLDVMRSIGADKVIDYTKEDYTRSGETYDVIFDVVAMATMFSRSKKCLKENGRLLLSNPRLSQMFGALWTSATSSKKVIFEFAGEKTEDLKFLKALIEAGNLRSVVDRCYPLEQTAEAHRYVQSGQKKGVVVMTVAHGIENQQR